MAVDYKPGGQSTVERFRGSGPGGQHRNKTETGIRLRHPSGIEVTVTKGRSLYQNLREAEVEMERRLDEVAKDRRGKAVNDKRRRALQPERAAKDITWNWQRGEVVFHRSGKKLPLAIALKGGFARISTD